MPKITDRGIASIYTKLETEAKANPNVKIGQKQALEILAAVGDRAGWSASTVLKDLEKPGITQQAQVDIAKKGMSSTEKKDLENILDTGTVALEPGARAFLEAVVGRTSPLPPPPPPVGNGDLKISGNQAAGIAGFAKAGDSIEAINLSAAPSGRLQLEDTMVIGKADATGQFKNAKLTGDQAMQEGDLIRMRARHADGTAGEWVTVKAQGVGAADTRNAAVAIFRIGLTDKGGGQIGVENINASRQISEPGAQLQLTNVRTGEKTKVTIDDKGSFPAGFAVPGKAGDVFSVAATDGKNDTAFATEVGKLTVPGGAPATGDLIKDPALHKDELNTDGTPKFATKRFTGPLFKDGPSPTDVQQGQLGDCYFPSAMSALAQQNSEAIQKMIKDNGDGTYTVNFKEKDWATGRYKDVPIKVDGDLYVRSWGGPLYGASLGADKGEKTMELWFPLVEKAYATWKGSYNDIGNGGMSSDVFQEVLGKDGQDMSIKFAQPDKLWSTLKTAIDNKQPVSAGTYGDDQEALYTNTGVHADHSYSVLGYKEVNGEKMVTIRNPWGESEPAGNGPNDGIFDLPLKDFQKLYQTLMYTN
jgi:hypothetical protein